MPTRMCRTNRRPLAAAATAALLAVLATPAAAQTAAPRKGEPVHSYGDAIRGAVRADDGLDGRAEARTGTRRAPAGWTDGRTGTIGESRDGTVATGVAATGVEALETTVPIAAVSSWYDHCFAQGAPLYGSGPDRLSDHVGGPDARAACDAVRREPAGGAPLTRDLRLSGSSTVTVTAPSTVRHAPEGGR